MIIPKSQTIAATQRHILEVNKLLHFMAIELLKRGERHDQSKLDSPELETFAIYTPKLAATTYGSPTYYRYTKAMAPALQHHYSFNRHHPEHHSKGVDGMTLIDVVEMFCDWKAATMRHNDGNILRSIEINKDRHHLSDQLAEIFKNTVFALNVHGDLK